MRQSKGEKTRLRILEMATELFYEFGIQNVTCAQIATAAGISQPAIYNHFENLHSIAIEAVRHWVQEAQQVIDSRVFEKTSADHQLMSMLEENFRYSANNRKKDALLFALLHYGLNSTEAMKLYIALTNAGIARIETLLDRGNRDRSWQIADPKEMAVLIHSLLLGEILKLIMQPAERDLEDRIELTNRTVRRILSTAVER
jgi:AcrR family transcriptional regulator